MEKQITGHIRRKKGWIICCTLLAFVLLCIGAFALYVGDYYHAEAAAIQALSVSDSVSVDTWEDGTLVFAPKEPTAGWIFYPGGKVEYIAYAPLMRACAERGILCVLVKMPCNLAVLDINAADGLTEQFPEITRWYIGGHSLGGAMAATYAAKHSDTLEGLILLAAYSTANLDDTALVVLSVYGSKDGVLDQEKYASCRENLPADTKEEILDGGCHAYFGSYGVQKGDGVPSISNEEQVLKTADIIAQWAG